MTEDSYETQTVRWSTLDGLMLEFLYYESYLEEAPSITPAQEDFAIAQCPPERMAILRDIREHVRQGRVQQATPLVQKLCPSFPAKQPDLWFHLLQHQFVELLRTEGAERALQFCKSHLAPHVLNLCPQASQQYKTTLMLLLQTNDGFSQCNPEQDMELAQDIHVALLASLNFQEPLFPILLRHLATTHNLYHIIRGLNSPFAELAEKILLPSRMNLPIPSSSDAFFSSSSSCSASSSPSSSSCSSPSVTRKTTSETTPMDIESVLPKIQKHKSSLPKEQLDRQIRSLALVVGVPSEEANACLQRIPNFANALHHMLSCQKINRRLAASWAIEYCAFRGLLTDRWDHIPKDMRTHEASFSNYQDKHDTLKRIRLLLTSEDEEETATSYMEMATTLPNIPEVVRLVVELYPALKEEHVDLYFKLKRCEFMYRVCNHQPEQALTIAQSILAPLTISYPELLPAFKDAMMMLATLPNDSLSHVKREATAVAGPLFSVLTSSLGLDEPTIVKFLKYLLHIHTLSYNNQYADNDPFDELFPIDVLKSAEVTKLNKVKADVSPKTGSSAGTTDDGDGRTIADHQAEETGSSSAEFSADKIASIMDILALPRAEAINLLRAYNGDVGLALAAMFE